MLRAPTRTSSTGGWIGLVLVVVLAAAPAVGWASGDHGRSRITVVVKQPPAKTSAAKADPFSIAGGTEARTVPLRLANPALLGRSDPDTGPHFDDDADASTLLERAKQEGRGVLYGRLQLVGRNAGEAPIRVRARLWRAAPPGAADVPQKGAVVELLPDAEDAATAAAASTGPARAERTVEAGGEQELRLVFVVPAHDPPSTVDGLLVLEALTGPGDKPVQRVDIPIKGTAKPMADVVLEPAKAIVQVTRLCPEQISLCGNEEEVTVRLAGNGATAALRDLRLANEGPIRVALRRDGRDEHEVWLEHLRPGDDADEVVGTLRWNAVTQSTGTGTYTGSLPLSRSAAGAPALPVELRVRHSFLIALVCVALGVVLSRVLFVEYALRRRRRRAQQALQDTLTAYWSARDALGSSPPIWTLDGEIVREPVDSDWKSYEAIETSGQMAAALEQARNDADLDEAEAAVLALRVDFLSWQAALGCLAKLQELEETAPPDHLELRWEDTQVATDSAVTLEAAKVRPATAADAATLRARILRQVAWRDAYQAAWERYGVVETEAAQAHDTDKLERLKKLGLHELDAGATAIAARTPDEQAKLLYRLGVISRRVERISDEAAGQPSTPRYREAVGSIAGDVAELTQLLRFANDPRVALARRSLARPAAPPAGAADGAAEVAAGPAAASAHGPSVPKKAWAWQRQRRRPRPQKLDVQGSPRYLGKFRFGDVLMTALIILGSALTYALTIYDEDWGSIGELASAFCAGVAGTAVVSWAALPIFESIRLRAKPPSA